MISSQYGTVFTKSHYEKIQKVYSVWICMNPPAKRKNTITGYSFSENNYVGNVQERIEYYDLITAIMVCLGASDDESENDLLRLLEVLLSPERSASEKKEILENDYDIPMTEKMEGEVEVMCNLSDGVEQRGIEKGIEQNQRLVVMNMLKENEPIEKICRYAECDENFVEEVKKEL